MYTTTEERSNLYGNAFDEVKFNKDKQWFEKQKNIQNTARPFWEAALRFIPFGIGEAISPAIMAGVNKGRSVYQGRLDRYLEMNNKPGFDYGFDSQGQFFEHKKRELPDWDSGMTTGQSVAQGIGGAVDSFAQWYTGSVNNEVNAMNRQVNQMNSSPRGGASGADTDAQMVGASAAAAGNNVLSFDTNANVTNNPSSNYATAPIMGGNVFDDTENYKKGGRMYFSRGGFDDPPVLVHGGSVGTDKIALVNTETGQDTGKRVDEGEMLVVSKETLDALQTALTKKDKKAVFDLMLDQVKQKPTITDDGMAGMKKGGVHKVGDDKYYRLDGVTLTANGKPIVFEEDFVVPKNASGLLDRLDYLRDVLGEGLFDVEDIDITSRRGSSFSKEQADKVRAAARARLQSEYDRLKPIASKAYKELGVDAFLPPRGSSKNNQAVGTGIGGSDYFAKNFQYKSNALNDGEVLKNSQVLFNNYSHEKDGSLGAPMNAVWNSKEGKWYHQVDGGKGVGQPIDERHQQELTLEYNKQASGLKYTNEQKPVEVVFPKNEPAPVVEQKAEPEVVVEEKPVVEDKPVVKVEEKPIVPVEPVITPGGDALSFEGGSDYGYGNGRNNAWNNISNGVGMGIDAMAMIQGAMGANTEIPKWSRTPEWNEVMGRMRLNSMRGFSPEEYANFQLQQDRQYASDVSNIYNLAGGSNAIALAALGRANNQQMLANMEWGAKDAQMQRQNLAQYGNYVGQDMSYDRMLFSDDFMEAKAKEQAGALAFLKARENMGNRMDHIAEYGKGSLYDQLQNEQLQGLRETNQYNRDYRKNFLTNFKSVTPGGAYDAQGQQTGYYQKNYGYNPNDYAGWADGTEAVYSNGRWIPKQ